MKQVSGGRMGVVHRLVLAHPSLCEMSAPSSIACRYEMSHAKVGL